MGPLFPASQKGKFAQGRSLYWHFPVYLQNYAGEEDQSRDAKFRTRPGSVIRKGKWKLHEYFEDGALLLFDLEKDPGETTNLASQSKKLKHLKEIYAWRKRVRHLCRRSGTQNTYPYQNPLSKS